jgi:hypothetical protein
MKQCLKKIFTLLMIIVFSSSVHAFTYALRLTEKEVQTKISEKQPIKLETKLLTITLTNPVVTFINETDEISIKSPVQIIGFQKKGYTSIKGILRYDATKGEFFLDKTKVEEFTFEGLPDKYQKIALTILQRLADEVLSKYPLYKFDESFTHKLAKALLISVKVEKRTLLIELGY